MRTKLNPKSIVISDTFVADINIIIARGQEVTGPRLRLRHGFRLR
jgi:hypothetical protein